MLEGVRMWRGVGVEMWAYGKFEEPWPGFDKVFSGEAGKVVKSGSENQRTMDLLDAT